MPALTFPSFPDDVPTHPLLVVDYELLQKRDPQEINRLWEAATKLGFWYLKNHGTDDLVNAMFELGTEVMALPLEERMKFEQGDEGMSFGYKAAGANAVNAAGEPDTADFLNVAKDDALAWPKVARRTYPDIANSNMNSTIVPFVRKSLEVNNLILEIFDEKLGLPSGTLLQQHKMDEHSASEARIIRNRSTPSTTKQAIGSHTDFGSLSFLHNRLGGLQVLVPDSESWQYVKPISGHAICNVGDALNLLSGGLLRSNLHRVVPPPGPQAGLERWSLVYFTRPGNSVVLRALIDQSPIIADAVKHTPEKNFDTGATSFDWFSRRIRNQRLNNRKGPETWMASRGTEAIPEA
ncbi:Clavaminate synthase-like protein [Pholiota conissans]|uniref:Clavaminate synthase-like protein n=1 Tax=Pholiota conissans TaxID=109636 RepID=A0A9P5Z7K8_9AGAR|nr:Clavaminate synthase-like protein [Pholiota conissans]